MPDTVLGTEEREINKNLGLICLHYDRKRQ